jgi:hypothetical protein
MIAAEMLLMRKKLRTLKMVTDRWSDEVTCKSTGSRQVGRLALRGLILA